VSSPTRTLESSAKQTRLGAAAGWMAAVAETARPRQWPKNLLVFAAPLAGASLGRNDGLGYALGATAAFVTASIAVYLVNDVIDAGRDRLHPVKRFRAVASGRLPCSHALALGGVTGAVAVFYGFWLGQLRRSQRLAAVVMLAAYLIWAAGQSNAWMRAWHLVSAVPLAAAVVRFDWLTSRAGTRPVEDLIARDRVMAAMELGWLLTFAAGL
jgi:4-hydroxybenzoate polyprenyltransferase